MSTTVSIRMPETTKEQINSLAKISHRNQTDMLLGWINERLELERWQMEEINKGINEADAGLFASKKEVADFFNQWKS